MTNPIDTDQPSIVLNELVVESGTFPTFGNNPSANPGGILIGSVRTFATATTVAEQSFIAGDQVPAEGQQLTISQNSEIFAVLGTAYGGNGTSNFDLPNLEGSLMTGAGKGGPTGTLSLGDAYGQNSVTLTEANLPTDVFGSDQSFSNDQPSLAIHYLINVGGTGTGLDVPGMIVPYLGNIAPNGYMFADGQVLSDSQYANLYAAIGDTYDAGTAADPGLTFALPNLQGRTIVGAGGAESLGATGGSDTTTLTDAELPSPDGSDTSIDNQQPFLALNYMIYIGINGDGPILPSSGALSANTPYLGEIMTFAGTTIPDGWTLAAGQALSINSNEALFSQLGTTYGGNGDTTFDLPDLEHESVAGTGGTQPLGTTYGTNNYTLTAAELPANAAPTITFATPTGNVVLQSSTFDLTTVGISVADSDSNGGVETLTLTASEGSFDVIAGTTAVTFGIDASGNDTISGTIDQLNAWLAGAGDLIFEDASTSSPSSAALTFSLDDNGHTGFPDQTTSEQLSLNVEPSKNPSITIDLTTYLSLHLGHGSYSLPGDGISVSDVDAGNGIEELLTIQTSSSGASLNVTAGSSGVTVTTTTDGFEVAGTLAQINKLLGGYGTLEVNLTSTQAENVITAFQYTDIVTGRTDIQDDTVHFTACYCPGTLIRTARGQKRIERLKIGDKVITASGAARPIKWIGRRSYAGRFVTGRKDILPVCIRLGALDENVPKRDLWISPHHAMYFKNENGGVLIEAKDLVNGISIVQAERVEAVEYFHIELETHDVVLAEGALSESYLDDDNRMMFHNARDYYALYPDGVTAPARYCSPRLDEGFEVETVRRRIAARAGLLRAADGERIGSLRGYIDEANAYRIVGWAQNVDHPDAPVRLDILANGQLIGQVLANRHRADLEQAGIGSGFHAFEFILPTGIDLATAEVRRSLDGAALQLSADPRLAVRSPKVAAVQRSPNVAVHRRAASA